ncbi:MAG: sugar ABC transporter permease [Lachnospiraceae bacterium]|nr:sugar ABC transporter permease [Lachnospiraceae bacterium]MBQ5431276.1 sugar ABC transporter permease [Lachnospiraceae bacterium]MBQ5485452.1 sugar ABC transporter permease [Lachnospiraceae bacterium]MCR4732306.1 sugar ABC transporter permease [Lachnospiraceae bacterium]SDW42552.1 carbohydrate ABC transporter membrane protein 1, CUT1 family [Lachnospiraceae bacterium KHCPX20]
MQNAIKVKPKLSEMARREERWAWLFIAAPFVGFLCFMAYPIVFAVFASFSRWTGMNSLTGNLVGLANYADILTDPKFWKSMVTTIIYMIGIPIGMFLGLVIAMALNRMKYTKRFFTTVYYVPVVSSLVAVSILWAWVFNYDYGLFNTVIKALTGTHGPNWLGDEVWVKVAMIIFMTWKGLGGSIILYLAGLQNIPRDYYEAAKIDGANGWQLFRHITIPLISPVTFYILITSLIGGFQVFVEVQVMTGNGGTNYSAATIVYYLYDKAFGNNQLGYGCAVAVLLAVIIFIITALNFKGQDKWVNTMD